MRFLLLLVLLIPSFSLLAQKKGGLPKDSLLLRLDVVQEKKKLKDVKVVLLGKDKEIALTTAFGKSTFTIKVPLDQGEYVFAVSKKGYMDRLIIVDTYSVPPWTSTAQLELELELLPHIDSAYSAFFSRTASGKLIYSVKEDGFIMDPDYMMKFSEQLKIMTDAERRKDPAAQLEYEFRQALGAGDFYFDKNQLDLAKQEYLKALELRPGDTYLLGRIKEIESRPVIKEE